MIPAEWPHITTAVGPKRYLYGLRKKLAHPGTAPAEHSSHKGFDEDWLGLVRLAGLLGSSPRPRRCQARRSQPQRRQRGRRRPSPRLTTVRHFYPSGGSMQISFLTRSTALALLLASVACAGNNSSDNEVGAARDTSAERIADSASTNQTESGMTDSSGQSTLGPEAEKTRSDQGQPVTSKGDTLNSGIDSSSTAR